jgi:hypothetical protein
MSGHTAMNPTDPDTTTYHILSILSSFEPGTTNHACTGQHHNDRNIDVLLLRFWRCERGHLTAEQRAKVFANKLLLAVTRGLLTRRRVGGARSVEPPRGCGRRQHHAGPLRTQHGSNSPTAFVTGRGSTSREKSGLRVGEALGAAVWVLDRRGVSP